MDIDTEVYNLACDLGIDVRGKTQAQIVAELDQFVEAGDRMKELDVQVLTLLSLVSNNRLDDIDILATDDNIASAIAEIEHFYHVYGAERRLPLRQARDVLREIRR